MDNITLGQIISIGEWIIGFIAIVTSLLVIIKKASKWIVKPINDKIENFEKTTLEKMDVLDTNQCRNFLVTYLNDIEQGEKKDEVVTTRAYEIFDHYTNDLKKNSYIKDKWNKVMKKR